MSSAAALPEGWEEAHDANGVPYYYNATMQVSQWEHPGVAQQPATERASEPGSVDDGGGAHDESSSGLAETSTASETVGAEDILVELSVDEHAIGADINERNAVTRVRGGSAADRAGLQVGDVVVAIDGAPLGCNTAGGGRRQ